MRDYGECIRIVKAINSFGGFHVFFGCRCGCRRFSRWYSEADCKQSRAQELWNHKNNLISVFWLKQITFFFTFWRILHFFRKQKIYEIIYRCISCFIILRVINYGGRKYITSAYHFNIMLHHVVTTHYILTTKFSSYKVIK